MIPVHMNSLAAAIPYVREKYDIKALKPPEAYVTNNPYENGQPLNDIIFILPVFFEDELVAFTGSVCHHLELGGAVAGSNADATDLYQEGIIIPTMKIDLERDLGDGPVERERSCIKRQQTKPLPCASLYVSSACCSASRRWT